VILLLVFFHPGYKNTLSIRFRQEPVGSVGSHHAVSVPFRIGRVQTGLEERDDVWVVTAPSHRVHLRRRARADSQGQVDGASLVDFKTHLFQFSNWWSFVTGPGSLHSLLSHLLGASTRLRASSVRRLSL